MASAITYKIGGKYDNRGEKDALKGLDSLTKAAKGFNLAVAGFVGAKVMQTFKKVCDGAQQSFVAQNKAVQNYQIAMNNANIPLKEMASLQSELSRNNFFDADSINNAMALAANMGKTSDQINNVMKAATDLASSGIMPLDQAVKTLSMSYEGNVAQLGKMLPDVKNLTKEELENGKAVDLIAEKYKGYADIMATSFSGRDTQFKNTFTDLQSSVGAIMQSFKFLGEGTLMKPLQDVTKWLVDNRNAIINFFLHLPEVGQIAFSGVKSILLKTFENIPEWISLIGVQLVQVAKDGFSTMFNVGKEAFNGLWTLLDFAIGNPFRKSKDFINTMLNNLIEGINDLPQHLPNWTKKLLGIDENTEMIKFRFKVDASDTNKTWKETAQGIEKSMKSAADAYKDGSKKVKEDWLKALDGSKNFYADEIANLKASMEAILGQDLPEELALAFDNAGVLIANAVVESSENALEATGTGTSTETSSGNNSGSLWGTLGEMGNLISNLISGNWFGIISDFVGYIASALQYVSPLFDWFLNVFTNTFTELFSEDSPVVKALNDLIDVFLDIWGLVSPWITYIGNILGKVLGYVGVILQWAFKLLDIFAPVFESLMQFIEIILDFFGIIFEILDPIMQVICNILEPIMVALYPVFAIVVNIIIGILNAVIAIYNFFAKNDKASLDYVSVKYEKGSLKNGSYSPSIDTQTIDTSMSSTISSASKSASYSAAKDVYVTINYNNSYVNGDAQQIAIQIAKEIKTAEKMNLV